MSHIHKAFDQKLAEIERLRASLKEATAKIKLLEKQVEQMSEAARGNTQAARTNQ